MKKPVKVSEASQIKIRNLMDQSAIAQKAVRDYLTGLSDGLGLNGNMTFDPQLMEFQPTKEKPSEGK